MIESLSAFFILEGLTFDGIGAYLIVKGLYPINPYALKRVKEIEEDFMKEQHNLTEVIGKSKNWYYGMVEGESLHLPTAINKQRIKLENLGKLIPTQIRTLGSREQHNHSLDYAFRGLSFLIGGFLLQGIGVTTQLFS